MDRSMIINTGMHVIGALLIILIFHFIGKFTEKTIITRNTIKNEKPSIVITTIGHIMYFLILFIGMLLMLRIFGFEIASIIAILSAAGLTFGLSLQGTLGDIASGILLTFFKIYDIGDVIQVGETEGKVLDFKLIHTVLEELNTKSISVVPNRKMQESIVHNITKQGYHYFIIDMLVSNKNKDFDHIRSIIRENLKDSKKFPDVIQDMPHRISILDMSQFGTKIRVRVPTNTNGDIAVKRGDIRNALRVVLEQNNIILMDPVSTAIANSH